MALRNGQTVVRADLVRTRDTVAYFRGIVVCLDCLQAVSPSKEVCCRHPRGVQSSVSAIWSFGLATFAAR
jgi:hypothetical protein